MNNRQKGNRGEELAASYLRAQGLTILERNYRCARGEIDIVAQEGAVVAFVEVKARRAGGAFLPGEAITPQKQERIRMTAEDWIARRGYGGFCRFDAVEVTFQEGRPPHINHWRNAF